ncbi:MAG: 50S ribosomal protein L29 [Candidatus Omnitrophota bacterium]
MTKPSELRNLTEAELAAKQLSLKEELMGLCFKARMGKLEKPSRISQIKRDIARILTILKEVSYAKPGTKKSAQD